MCGIVGIAGNLSVAAEKAFRDMLVFDSVRGEDSTGAAIIHNSGDIDIVKEVGDPFCLISSSRFTKALRAPSHCIIGHNRYATTGKVNRANAHPFEAGDLIGAHNGTLKNKYSIPGHVAYDTDSEALYNFIDDVGVEDAMIKVEGAWALSWYNKEDKSINFLRNAERPLYVGVSEDNKLIMWASEAWMMTVAATRNNIKIKYKELPVNSWHKYIIPAVNGTFEEPIVLPVFGKPEEKKTTQTSTAGFMAPTVSGGTGTSQSSLVHIARNNTSVRVRGLSIEKDQHKHTYLEMLGADDMDMDIYRVYGDEEQLLPMLTGLWEGTIQYGVFQNKVPQYYKLGSLSMKRVVIKTDNHNQPILKGVFEEKHKRCTNCNSKLEYEEEWFMIDGHNVLCEQCSEAGLINITKQLCKGC